MSDEFHQLQRKWEKRAKVNKRGLRGVLYQGLPKSINQLLNLWHEGIVASHFIPVLARKGMVLDIGSGYGRLSAQIKKICCEMKLVGIDFSGVFCQRYRDQFGDSVCAAIEHLPLGEGVATGALVVTALMYVPKDQCKRVVAEIMQTVQPGGVVLFIDPGKECIQLLRSVFPHSGRKTTGGDGFKLKDYAALFQSPSHTVVSSGSNIVFTLCLPLLLVISRTRQIMNPLGRLILRLEHFFRPLSRFALHRWVLVQRDR